MDAAALCINEVEFSAEATGSQTQNPQDIRLIFQNKILAQTYKRKETNTSTSTNHSGENIHLLSVRCCIYNTKV